MPPLTRRRFLNLSVAGAAASTLPLAASAQNPAPELIDSSIHLFRWPFRRLPLDDTTALVAKLRSLGTELGKILGANISDPNRRLILGANYRRLLAPLLRIKK